MARDPKLLLGFFAYPAVPPDIGHTIESASKSNNQESKTRFVNTWKALDIAGHFISESVIESIDKCDFFLADITYLNFNVLYEIGYAIGKKKRIVLTKNAAYTGDSAKFNELGIIDNIGYSEYENTKQLATIIESASSKDPLEINQTEYDRQQTIYITGTKHTTDASTRIFSRLKKARLFFRSFDPIEQSRLSSFDAIKNVAKSFGVLAFLIPEIIEDSYIHNTRSAFIIGLSHGMEKVTYILQQGEEPVPLDFRDFVKPFKYLEQIDEYIQDFATEVVESLQTSRPSIVHSVATFLEKLNIGASFAENEFFQLDKYYLETDTYKRARRGEIRIITGRKGSGKTAIFGQIRGSLRADKRNIILDLAPEGYKLLKFKEAVLDLLKQGTQEHTIMAVWEYLLHLEICRKILEKDKVAHTRDMNLYALYGKLEEIYQKEAYETEGDFSERLASLIGRFREDFETIFKDNTTNVLSGAQITELLYKHNVAEVHSAIESYLKFKKSVWLLFDNIDKGWPTHGVKPEDVLIIKELLEATRKIERRISRAGIEAHTIVFLRNDVYELLVQETIDRGKETKASVDWTDCDLLRELIRLRLISNGLPENESFEDLWHKICVSHIEAEESSQYLIDRSLMRPRSLIDLINQCRGYAVNLKHKKIEIEDIKKGLKTYSIGLITEISLEIRDVFPAAENVILVFIGQNKIITEKEMNNLLESYAFSSELVNKILQTLLWYGVLGVVNGDDILYIYSVDYEMPLLKGHIQNIKRTSEILYYINPAFWSGLSIIG